MRSSVLSAADLQRALDYLEATRNALVASVNGLSGSECDYKPGAEDWSIRDVVEHLAIVETRFIENVGPQLRQSPAPDIDFDTEEADRRVMAVGADRSLKIKAPGRVAPKGGSCLDSNLAQFQAARENSAEFFRSVPELRDHAMPHPLLGPLDGYQWALLLAAHTERHVKQILEIKLLVRRETHALDISPDALIEIAGKDGRLMDEASREGVLLLIPFT